MLTALGFEALHCGIPDIDLWQTSLNAGAPQIRLLAALLAPDEQKRAARFFSPDDCRRFTVARGMLRQLLGNYLEVAPEELKFCYGPLGKPQLKGAKVLNFNLAHAGERAAYAVSAAIPVGVDIENVSRNIDFERVARRFFTPNEFAALIMLPNIRRRRAFFRLWTAKEAVIKATGKGLAQSLDEFEIDLKSIHSPRVLRSKNRRIAEMVIHTLHSGRAYVVSVAAPHVNHPAVE
jgi:4'-phosphopantetheinyl transferase